MESNETYMHKVTAEEAMQWVNQYHATGVMPRILVLGALEIIWYGPGNVSSFI